MGVGPSRRPNRSRKRRRPRSSEDFRARSAFPKAGADLRRRGRQQFRWHWIVAAIAPRMTPANPFHAQPGSGGCPVGLDGINGIFRATRREPALTKGAEQKGLGRRQGPPVGPHREQQKMLDRIHNSRGPADGSAFWPRRSPCSRPPRRSVVRKSRSTSARFLPAIDARATRTRSSGWARSC